MVAKYRECETCHSKIRIRREKALGRPAPRGLAERNKLVAEIAAARGISIPEASHAVRVESLWPRPHQQ